MDTSFNFVTLFESDPMRHLAANNNGQLLQRIRETFTEFQQQLYAAFQHCHDNYSLTDDYIIDLDHVWKWLGFPQKSRAKVLLEKNFDLGTDYKLNNTLSREQTGHSRGGHNKQTFLMNLDTFKCLCLKAKTERARLIQDYYIKLQDNLFTFGIVELADLRSRVQEMNDRNDELRRRVQETNVRDEPSNDPEPLPAPIQPTNDTTSNSEQYPHSIDELVVILRAQKVMIHRFIRRNFRRNIHFIEVPCPLENQERRGGHNRIDVRLTKECYDMSRNSYNLRNRNITENIGNIQLVSIIRPIETQTITFIENCFKSTLVTYRQFRFGNYRVDLFIREYGIVVECDEFGHSDRDPVEEYAREIFIYSQGVNKIIRYNPNEEDFCISGVINRIYSEITFLNQQRYRQQFETIQEESPYTSDLSV
jgi:very-short-patch-repair endonuclease